MLMGEAVAFVAAVEKFAGDDDGVCREMEGSCLRRMGPTHSHNLKIRFTNARQQEGNIGLSAATRHSLVMAAASDEQSSP
ncbi:hypothetical protein GUJ93_ZPchr0014g46824 [Zizania palustris]|uniref:Uncharacterized protein n=1 Tax=Zizania palustris TaxID=103762 RepID=A0A8J5VSI7_ZIZPA|nr:hypothetical protein GUJ93_ZPchr0014g46824 [Zizania palustris]